MTLLRGIAFTLGVIAITVAAFLATTFVSLWLADRIVNG